MLIIIAESDIEEAQGIEWFLKAYIPHRLYIKKAINTEQVIRFIEEEQPQLLIIDITFINMTLKLFLQNYPHMHIISTTMQPMFQYAATAIEIQSRKLFVKPIPLEDLKKTILSLPLAKHEPVQSIALQRKNVYDEIFYREDGTIVYETFFTIELKNVGMMGELAKWLRTLTIFQKIDVYPLNKRMICFVDSLSQKEMFKVGRLLINEWKEQHGEVINICFYDEEPTTVNAMYRKVIANLSHRFYKGYEQVFFTSDPIKYDTFDPLLTPEQQQLWIHSLEHGDMAMLKASLLQLRQQHYYHEEVRIHLTSVLAQIRRFMMKYHLQLDSHLEKRYRNLFHIILDEPILHVILQEIIVFLQSLLQKVQSIHVSKQADYTEQAIAYIEQHYADSSINLQQMARDIGINANYLSSLFTKKQGLHLKKYLSNYRIQQASKLLLTTDMPVSEIAVSCGFEDVNYFIKVFKQYFNDTPLKYRHQHKGK
ncbi:helix-turn-helix domain-containing protein [Lysinibacillus sp. KU-BSD001]|uniref:helix-turn-helix domain-containing protein n=1 Tax=Lysinibacillus sp. KU-BSD001 TaxID=3141328 RepID=UPI0036E0F36C